MKVPRTARRQGVALILVIVALVVFTTLVASITVQTLAGRRFVDRRQDQQQSLWLARSGLERALAHLLTNRQYKGETTTLIPLGEVKITVNPSERSADIFQITSESRFPTDAPNPVVRTLSRRYRRVMDGSTVKLEVLEPSPPRK